MYMYERTCMYEHTYVYVCMYLHIYVSENIDAFVKRDMIVHICNVYLFSFNHKLQLRTLKNGLSKRIYAES